MNTYFQVKQIRKKQKKEIVEQKEKKEEKKKEKEEESVSRFVSDYNKAVKSDCSVRYEEVRTLVDIANISIKSLRNILRHNQYSHDDIIPFSWLFRNPYKFSKIYPTLLTYKKSEYIEIALNIPKDTIPVIDKMESFIISIITQNLNYNNDTYITKRYLESQIQKELDRNKKKIFENKIKGREKENNTLLNNIAIIKKSIDALTIERHVYFDYASKFNKMKPGYRARGVTLKKIYEMERQCQQIINNEFSDVPSSEEVVAIPEDIQKFQKFQFTDEQVSCFTNAINYPMSVICGPPGSGKTAIIIGINDYFIQFNSGNKAEHLVINLAYCGKAVRNIKYRLRNKKYMRSSRCYTLHKFLYYEIYKHHDDEDEIQDNYDNSVIIVDESSMICLNMFVQLLKFVEKHDSTVIFVGDDEQLPPIGMGNPFQTMLNFIISGRLAIPFVKLTKVHRNGDEVKKMLAHIKTKEFPVASGEYYLNEKENAVLSIYDINYSLDDFDYHLSTLDKEMLMRPNHTLFLVAEHEGDVGTIALNAKLQKYINPSSRRQDDIIYKHFNERMFNNDKVLRIANNYTRKYHRYNGDEGIVVKLKNDKTRVKIKYWNEQNNSYGNMEGGIIGYDDFEEIISIREFKEEFKLGYCRTIHKSQGGEADNVIIFGPVKYHYSWTSSSGRGIKLLRVALSRVKKGKIHLFCHPEVISEVLDKKEHLSTTSLFEYFD